MNMKTIAAAIALALTACGGVAPDGVAEALPAEFGTTEKAITVSSVYGSSGVNVSQGGWGWEGCNYEDPNDLCVIPNGEEFYDVRLADGPSWVEQSLNEDGNMIGGSHTYYQANQSLPGQQFLRTRIDLSTGWNFSNNPDDHTQHAAKYVRVACHAFNMLPVRADGDGAEVGSCSYYQFRFDTSGINEWATEHYPAGSARDNARRSLLIRANRWAWSIARGLPSRNQNKRSNGSRRISDPRINIDDVVDNPLPLPSFCESVLFLSPNSPPFNQVVTANGHVCFD